MSLKTTPIAKICRPLAEDELRFKKYILYDLSYVIRKDNLLTIVSVHAEHNNLIFYSTSALGFGFARWGAWRGKQHPIFDVRDQLFDCDFKIL